MNQSKLSPPLLLGLAMPMLWVASCGASNPPPTTRGADTSYGDGDGAGNDGGSQAWRGAFAVASGVSFDFTVVILQAGDGSLSGTISIPMQRAMNLPLSEITVEADEVAFRLAVDGQPPETASRWSLRISGDTASGMMRQGPLEVPVEARRVAVEEAIVRRPQTPQPPFPYRSRDVRFDSTDGSATLAGTLTIPEGDGPHPAAILISGSGLQDRDEEVFEHRPFLVIADNLTRAGVAVLRYDDRGFAESTGDPRGATFDFLNDAAGAVAFLRGQGDIDAERIGAIGHSEGGVIAPMLAARDAEVAFVVMLAGPGVRFSELMVRQLADTYGPSATPEQIETLTVAARAVYAAMGAGDEEVRDTHFRTMVRIQLEIGGAPSDDASLDVAVQRGRTALQHPWLRAAISIDAADYLPSVRCPVLALNGTLDTQVAAEPNLAGVESLLARGGNQAVRTVALEGLNHLFQPAVTGQLAEYPEIETTFDEDALNLLRDWVVSITNR